MKKSFVKILDEYDQPTAAKIRITAHDSVYYAPDGHLVDFPFTNFGGDVILDNNRRFAYVDGSFEIDLPEGENIRFEAVKGFAYRLFDKTVKISTHTDSITIQLEKWFEFPKGKWFSGDVHVHHIDPATALLEMKAEDLNVCNVLTSDFTTDQDRFRGTQEPIYDSLHLIYINQEYRENRLGHVNLLNLKKLINVKPLREYQYPLNMAALDQAHAQGGHVSWAHFAAWPGLEGPLAMVMKKVDAVELLSTVDPFTQPVFVTDIIPDLRMNSGLKIWYRLLNCGLKLPATAGTDKMTNWVTVGANRVYAQIKGDFSYQAWIEALNKGSTFVTNSPFLFCSVSGKDPGEQINLSKQETIKIVAEVWSQFPLDRLEIIANGEVIKEKIIEKGQTHATLEIEFKPAGSAWIAARAHRYNEDDMDNGVSFIQRRDFGGGPTLLNNYYGTMRPETAFAHTSPTYVIVDHQPIHSKRDAEYFVTYLENGISWLQKSGRFPTEGAKKEVLDTFRKGQEAFRKLSK